MGSRDVATLVAALSEGMNPEIVPNGNPLCKLQPGWSGNAGNYSYGAITLRQGTASTRPTLTPRLKLLVSIRSPSDVLCHMGIRTQLQPYLSTTLVLVTPIEQHSICNPLAVSGVRRDVVAITRIEDRNGNVIYEQGQPSSGN